ncbi:hypothetical protein ACIQ6Y_38295 [Streptomyces sp. NPDC096205]|uniref:hypothetical protein n=1 Tax=Streptomyces sp. NPDC096205 TaxID=3366081 RepID=UPI0037F5EF74
MGFTEQQDPEWRECRVELPTPGNWIVLDLSAAEPEPWARSVSSQHLAASSPQELLDGFAKDLLWYWTVAVRQQALCAALLAPPNESVIASYSVRELKVPPEALRLDILRAEAEAAVGPYFGSPRVSEAELPVGPALRVNRLEPSDPESSSGTVVEGVCHYVLPRRASVALECRLLWTALGLGEELGKVADELAASLRLV